MDDSSKLYDRRVVDRYREKGMIKDSEFEAHLKNLPDETPNAQWVQIDLYEAEMGEGEGNVHTSILSDDEDDDEAAREEGT
jgi:hypothetical protein